MVTTMEFHIRYFDAVYIYVIIPSLRSYHLATVVYIRTLFCCRHFGLRSPVSRRYVKSLRFKPKQVLIIAVRDFERLAPMQCFDGMIWGVSPMT